MAGCDEGPKRYYRRKSHTDEMIEEKKQKAQRGWRNDDGTARKPFRLAPGRPNKKKKRGRKEGVFINKQGKMIVPTERVEKTVDGGVRLEPYTHEAMRSICADISSGMSLRDALQKRANDGRKPSNERTFYRWIRDIEQAAELYKIAKEERAHWYANRLSELANEVLDNQHDVKRARFAADQWKWLCCRLFPKEYAEQAQTSGGKDGGRKIEFNMTLVASDERPPPKVISATVHEEDDDGVREEGQGRQEGWEEAREVENG